MGKKEIKMKKKNGFWATLVAICLCLPAIFILSGCGHKHSYSEQWSNDAEYHWHICTGDDCNEVTSKGEHIYDNDSDKTCNICGYTRIAQENTFSSNIRQRTYNGKTQGLVQGVDFTVLHGTASVSYKLKDSSDDFSSTEPMNAGKYIAKIVVTGNALYESIYKDNIEFEIEKYDLDAIVQDSLTISYGQSLPYEDRLFAPSDKLFSDKLYVKYTFDSNAVGSESTKTELITKATDESVLNNYKFDATKATAKIGKKAIYLDSTKEPKLNIYNTLDDGFTLIELSAQNFGIVGSEKVSIQVVGKASDFESGKIKLVTSAEDVTAGSLLATLVGEDADNYYLTGTANATYTKRQSTFSNGSVNVVGLGETDYHFGATSDAIVYGENHFVVNKIGNKDWFEILAQSNDTDSSKDYINKEAEIKIWCGSTLIATMYRVKSSSGTKFDYNNGTFDNDNGIADFKLTPNIDGYTDSEGRWICTTPSVTLSMDIIFTDIG